MGSTTTIAVRDTSVDPCFAREERSHIVDAIGMNFNFIYYLFPYGDICIPHSYTSRELPWENELTISKSTDR